MADLVVLEVVKYQCHVHKCIVTKYSSKVNLFSIIEQEIELVNKALSGNLVIPDFASFTKQIKICFRKCEILPDGATLDNHSTTVIFLFSSVYFRLVLLLIFILYKI